MKYFHLWLKYQQQEKKLTSSQLSKDLNVSKATITLWLQNKRKPDSTKLVSIINYFFSSKSKRRIALFEIFYGKKGGFIQG